MAEIFGYSIMGGGGTGATLTVTGVAGDTVTASKDGKTYTRTFDSNGVAVFKGLATGTWTVTMTNGTQTATITVVVTADYETTLSYFTATINVTYPAGATCTATDGTTTLTAPDTSGSWSCVVPNVGTWTVTATRSNQTKSQSVSITTKGQIASVTLAYILYLFNKGDVSSVTGGWTNEIQLSGGELLVSGGDSFQTGCTYKSFSTRGYKTLTYSGRVSYNNNWQAGFRLGLSRSFIHGKGLLDDNFVVSSPDVNRTVNVDITKAQGDFYFLARGYMGTANISQIYLH